MKKIKIQYTNGIAKTTPFYKKYGITMAEAGRLVGVSKEAIRRRYKLGQDPLKPHNRAELRGNFSHRQKRLTELKKML